MESLVPFIISVSSFPFATTDLSAKEFKGPAADDPRDMTMRRRLDVVPQVYLTSPQPSILSESEARSLQGLPLGSQKPRSSASTQDPGGAGFSWHSWLYIQELTINQ